MPRPLRILSHRLYELGLEEVEVYFGMKGSAVSKASRRLRDLVKEDRSFRKLHEGIEKGLLNVEA